MSESLTLSSDDGKNSNIRSMSWKKDSIVPGLRNYTSLLVSSRDDIFDLFVTINKGIRCLMILITRSSSPINK